MPRAIENGESLAVRGKFIQGDAVPVLGEGFHPFRTMLRQILGGHRPARFSGMGDDPRRQFSAVERFTAGFGEDLQGTGHPLGSEEFPR